jgi:hypothetical protein
MPMIGFLLEINGGAIEAGILSEIRNERCPSTGNLSKKHYNTSGATARRLRFVPGQKPGTTSAIQGDRAIGKITSERPTIQL